jgi:hypothetical protein
MEPDPLADQAEEVDGWEVLVPERAPAVVASVPVAEKKYLISREYPVLT